jgi:SAM-dependent methyltransferase
MDHFTYQTAEISRMTRTARSAGAVGRNALVPRIVDRLAIAISAQLSTPIAVLDYGCGHGQHLPQLSGQAYVNVAYGVDFAGESGDYRYSVSADGADAAVSLVGPLALPNVDVAFASNVLNVQALDSMDRARARAMIGAIGRRLGRAIRERGGVAVANYPQSPRGPLTVREASDAFHAGFCEAFKWDESERDYRIARLDMGGTPVFAAAVGEAACAALAATRADIDREQGRRQPA